jgi:foldase protein PrsA
MRSIRSAALVLLPLSILIILVAGTVVALCPRGAGAAEPEIVARVNGEPLPRADLQHMLADPRELVRFQQELDGLDPDDKELERLALRELIHRRLILQEAHQRNFTVTEDELDQALSALRRRFGDLVSFGAWMHEQGLDDKSLFDVIRAGMLTNRVTAALVEEVRVTEKQVQEYYEAHKKDLKTGEEVRLRIIAVKSRVEAEEILATLKKGEKFSLLARTRSMGMLAAQGGDTGWNDSRTLPTPLQRVVGMLKVGDIGGPVQKAEGEFLLVGLEGRRPVRAKSLAAARPEIEQHLLAIKQQEAIQAWLTGQEKKSKIEVFL